MKPHLNERTRRLWVATEAKSPNANLARRWGVADETHATQRAPLPLPPYLSARFDTDNEADPQPFE
jgi:hypothetical protein